MWPEVLKELGILSLVFTASVFILRKAMDLLFSKDLEKFKSDLENQAFQNKIRYEKLHTERAEVIKELYKKIVKVDRAFKLLMCPLQPTCDLSEEQMKKEAAESVNGMMFFYEENRVFFEELLALDIDSLCGSFRSCWNNFKYAREGDVKHKAEAWGKSWDQLSKDDGEVVKVKKKIENEFRKIIGLV